MRGVADGCGYLPGRVTTILLRVSDFSNKFRYSSLGGRSNTYCWSPQRQGVTCGGCGASGYCFLDLNRGFVKCIVNCFDKSSKSSNHNKTNSWNGKILIVQVVALEITPIGLEVWVQCFKIGNSSWGMKVRNKICICPHFILNNHITDHMVERPVQ